MDWTTDAFTKIFVNTGGEMDKVEESKYTDKSINSRAKTRIWILTETSGSNAGSANEDRKRVRWVEGEIERQVWVMTETKVTQKKSER